MTPYSGPKLSDFYTLSQTKLLENHTLHNGTYLYIPYRAVPPPPPPWAFPNQVRPSFTDLVSDKGDMFLNGVKPVGYQSRCR